MVVGLAVALLSAACGDDKTGTSTSGAAGKAGGTFKIGIGEPTAIDPYNTQDSEGHLVQENLFEGLVNVDNSTKALTPGVAEKWSRNDDCTEWTFNLRKGTKFSNGEDVTAQSFIDGINRSVAEKAASDVAYFAAGIEGFAAVNGGGKDKPATTDKLAGLSAPDANTLKVKMGDADCEFDKVTLQPIFSPVPKTAGAFDNKTYNDLPIGNGPFKMEGPWQHDKSITMVRNDTYFGTKTKIDRVEITIETVADEYKGYQAGQRDWARIPPELIAQAKSTYEKDGNFVTFVATGINHLLVQTVNPPFNNADARKAISAAIDRQAIIDGIFKTPLVKADSIVPPAFEAYKKLPCEACNFNVAKAKEFATKGGLTASTKVTIAYNEDGGHKAWVDAIVAQLKTNLGVQAEAVPVPKFADLLNKEQEASASGLFRTGWGADYPSPVNFLAPLLKTGAGDNRGKYSNKTFDETITKAAAAKTDTDRNKLAADAEKIAIADDMALIPLWYRTQFRVFDSKKWVGLDPDFFENPTLATAGLK